MKRAHSTATKKKISAALKRFHASKKKGKINKGQGRNAMVGYAKNASGTFQRVYHSMHNEMDAVRNGKGSPRRLKMKTARLNNILKRENGPAKRKR